MEREKNQILYLVIPCYNEQEVLPETSRRLKEKMESLMDRNMISRDSKIMFVNDGSKDRTWEMIEELHDQDPLYQGVKLSRNRGHQNALLGGLMTAKEYADMVISLDADLQDDIDVIDQFVEMLILRNAQLTILHRDNAVRARCVKSRHRHPVPVRADRELCLIAVTIRLLHPHNLLHHGINEFRRKSSDTDQIAAHLFLLIAKLLPIVHRLDLAATTARI